MASTTTELAFLLSLLRDLGLYLDQPPTLFCDNISALHLTINLVFHVRTKHVEIDYHFVYEKVALGCLLTRFFSSQHHVTDIFTKALAHQYMIFTGNSSKLIEEFKKSMMAEFEMTDLGLLHYFSEMEIIQDSNGFYCIKENIQWIC